MYLFYGTVLPERAQLSAKYALKFSHFATGKHGSAKVSIVLNQVAVSVASSYAWDVFDLRNVVINIVQGQLAMVGYLTGFAYDLAITRVLNEERDIDYVFGIDVPCIAERAKNRDLNADLSELRSKSTGTHGVFIGRCFNDLVSAMKHADDTAFYCYRAIEALRHHCVHVHGMESATKAAQWEKFRMVAGCKELVIRAIKEAADPLRHGGVSGGSANDRGALFTGTWDIVDGYLAAI